jgi:hypothetical protein
MQRKDKHFLFVLGLENSALLLFVLVFVGSIDIYSIGLGACLGISGLGIFALARKRLRDKRLNAETI